MAGSSTCLNTVVGEPTDLAVTHYPSAVGPEGYVTEVGINTAGEAVDWLASLDVRRPVRPSAQRRFRPARPRGRRGCPGIGRPALRPGPRGRRA